MNLFPLLAQEQSNVALTPAGIVIMTGSILLVLSLCAFCFWRILRDPNPSDRHHTPLDYEPSESER